MSIAVSVFVSGNLIMSKALQCKATVASPAIIANLFGLKNVLQSGFVLRTQPLHGRLKLCAVIVKIVSTFAVAAGLGLLVIRLICRPKGGKCAYVQNSRLVLHQRHKLLDVG